MADRDPIPVADDEGVDTEYQGNAEQEEAQISEETVSKGELLLSATASTFTDVGRSPS